MLEENRNTDYGTVDPQEGSEPVDPAPEGDAPETDPAEEKETSDVRNDAGAGDETVEEKEPQDVLDEAGTEEHPVISEVEESASGAAAHRSEAAIPPDPYGDAAPDNATTGRQGHGGPEEPLPDWAVKELRILRKELFSLLTMVDSIVGEMDENAPESFGE